MVFEEHLPGKRQRAHQRRATHQQRDHQGDHHQPAGGRIFAAEWKKLNIGTVIIALALVIFYAGGWAI